jgi:RHS repeat-associated protein
VVTKYVYDGDHCIAEYTGLDQLRRKYIYGPGVDQPISMIEAAGSYAGTYYYHFDALGSVVGLTNSSGNTVEVYEYDVYGRLGASDASHPNRIMFTGREYDKETGLYYYRARYYNPQIGRFLQTDPVGYETGVNWYRYCVNNPLNCADPQGLRVWREKNGGEWHREAKPGNVFPEIAGPMWAPFFTQHFPTSCVGIAILNAALNAGTEPLKKSEVGGRFSDQKTDLQAEGWVMAQIKAVNPSSNAFNYGSDIRAAPLILGAGWSLEDDPLTAGRIRAEIDANKTIIMGIDINTARKDMNGDRVYDGQDRQWHAVTIMKVPENVAPKIAGRDYKYYVVNADPTDEMGEGNYFTQEEFDAWLSCYPAIHGEWVLGPGANLE